MLAPDLAGGAGDPDAGPMMLAIRYPIGPIGGSLPGPVVIRSEIRLVVADQSGAEECPTEKRRGGGSPGG